MSRSVKRLSSRYPDYWSPQYSIGSNQGTDRAEAKELSGGGLLDFREAAETGWTDLDNVEAICYSRMYLVGSSAWPFNFTM